MSLRHKGREFALQMLFQWEMGHQQPTEIEAGFWKAARSEKKTRDFANQLFEGAVSEAEEIDTLLVRHAKNWRLERMAVIDRAILRLAVHELRARKTPDKVIMNEAVELAKKYSSADAAPFVNGILDAIHKGEDRPEALS
ncbi:MAG TPA: transcription antitermination factor NusB [Candidatus Dormibacteraeota bacterium]|nr:transcription antitermination factor NusB [Candidatus Dormibacteraeota bacterium]